IEPMAGFDPTSKMILVRNPNYDPQTDDPATRANNVDGISILINPNNDDIFNKIRTGDLDGTLYSEPPGSVRQAYLSDPELKERFHTNAADSVNYVTMNLLA